MVVVDPFARDSHWGTITNDQNPDTEAEDHMEARDFLQMLADEKVKADAILFDPPYSPTQISEHYKALGISPTNLMTSNNGVRRVLMSLSDQTLKLNWHCYYLRM